MTSDAEKTEFNERAKASMRFYLRSKSWVEKVESIERMNVADKLAKQAMREALAREAASGGSTRSE
jgi:hypothetical protein